MYKTCAKLALRFLPSLSVPKVVSRFLPSSIFSNVSFLVTSIDVINAKTNTSFLTTDSFFKNNCWRNSPFFYIRNIWLERYFYFIFWDWCLYLLQENLSLISIFIYIKNLLDTFGLFWVGGRWLIPTRYVDRRRIGGLSLPGL